MRLPLWGEERRQATIAAADWRLCVTLRCQEEIYRDKEQEVWGEDIYFKRQKKFILMISIVSIFLFIKISTSA